MTILPYKNDGVPFCMIYYMEAVTVRGHDY